MMKLAVHGGRPVREADKLLPDHYPRAITKRSYELIKELLDSGWLLEESMVDRFEKALATASNAEHAIALHNCTAGLHAALCALKAMQVCEPGDEVIVNPITDFGSAEGILSELLVPVFADVDRRTGIPTAEDIKEVMTDRTRVIIIVHMYGQAADMDPIMELADGRGIPVLEDIAQAPLIKYKGRTLGTIGLGGSFAFGCEKHMNADAAGAVITNNEEFARFVRLYSQKRGETGHVEGFGRVHGRLGINFQIGQLRAALGLGQLEPLPEELARRMELCEYLDKRLADIEGVTPGRSLQKEAENAYWMYTFLLDEERFSCTVDEFAEAMQAEGLWLGTGRYYLLPDCMAMLHRDTEEYDRLVKTIPRLAEREYSGDMTPKAKRRLDRMFRWNPTHKYTYEDMDDIYLMIKKVADHYRR